MVKRVRRIISGQCAIGRICGDGDVNNTEAVHTKDMTIEFYEEWQKSSRLKPSFDKYSKDYSIPIEEVTETICKIKKIDLTLPCIPNLKLCLKDIEGVNQIRQYINEQSNIKYDKDNETHEQNLELLWNLLLPGVERDGGRFSKDWNKIGFQQSDPSSDFRGAGILSLNQLIYIAQNRTAVSQKMIVEPKNEMSRYPWACVGINLTNEVIQFVNSNLLDAQLYGLNLERSIIFINEMYCDMFQILHHAWVTENPENVLAFPGVKKRVLQDIEHQLSTNGSLALPTSNSSSSSS